MLLDTDCAVMDNFHNYEALSGSVKMEDITNNEGNADILRRLSANDSDFTEMWLQQDRDDEYDFLPTTAKEMGWLGYFVGKSTQLKSFHIITSNLGDWNDIIEPFCNGLSRNKSIERINIENVDLSEGEIFGMMQPFFKNSASLKTLAVHECRNFGAEGCRLLSVALGSCASKTLQDVSITYNGIEDGQLVDIIVALSTHPHLKTLKLYRNQMGRNTCMALATLVQWTATELSGLCLGDNAIGDEGIELLAPALAKSTLLKTLSLSRNGISSKGIESLSTLLKSSNCKLEFVGLSGNQIGDDGAKILASSLANNVSLESLGLAGTNITNEGWTAFANLLCDSSSVHKTYLSNHTLKYILLGTSRNNSSVFTGDVTPLLTYNDWDDTKKVAARKIIKTHKDLSMETFFELDLKVLPIAVKWFDNAISMFSQYVFHEHMKTTKLSAIYQFIRGLPLLYIGSRLKQELSEMQREAMVVQQEELELEAMRRALAKRKEVIEQRTQSIINRLGGGS